MSKDKIRRKKINYIKGSKKIKGERKTLIRGLIKNFSWRVKLNSKITLLKGKTNQKNKG
jgi:hypothetical protein